MGAKVHSGSQPHLLPGCHGKSDNPHYIGGGSKFLTLEFTIDFTDSKK